MSANRPFKIFISYSHADAVALGKLKKHMTQLAANGLVQFWTDVEIDAGANWRTRLDEAVSNSDYGLLLVSANFLASAFIQDAELPALLRRCGQERLIPVILDKCEWRENPFISESQAVPAEGRAIRTFARETGYYEAVARIRVLLEKQAASPREPDYEEDLLRLRGSLRPGMSKIWPLFRLDREQQWTSVKATAPDVALLIPGCDVECHDLFLERILKTPRVHASWDSPREVIEILWNKPPHSFLDLKSTLLGTLSESFGCETSEVVARVAELLVGQDLVLIHRSPIGLGDVQDEHSPLARYYLEFLPQLVSAVRSEVRNRPAPRFGIKSVQSVSWPFDRGGIAPPATEEYLRALETTSRNSTLPIRSVPALQSLLTQVEELCEVLPEDRRQSFRRNAARTENSRDLLLLGARIIQGIQDGD